MVFSLWYVMFKTFYNNLQISFSYKTVTEKRKGKVWKFTSSNALYGLHQQPPQPNIDVSCFWWGFGACVLWFYSILAEVHDSNRLRCWHCVAHSHINQECTTHAQAVINHVTLRAIPGRRYCSAVKCVSCGWALSYYNMVDLFKNDTTTGIIFCNMVD